MTNEIKLMQNDSIDQGEELLIEFSKRCNRNGFTILEIILKAFYQLKEEARKSNDSCLKAINELSNLKAQYEMEFK